MIDEIKTLLLDKTSDDDPSSATLESCGLSGDGAEYIISALMPVIYAPDLAVFTGLFDPRVTVHRRLTMADLASRDPVHGIVDSIWENISRPSVRQTLSSLFSSPVLKTREVLHSLRDLAFTTGGPTAIGAILVACAYRRLVSSRGSR